MFAIFFISAKLILYNTQGKYKCKSFSIKKSLINNKINIPHNIIIKKNI